MSREVSIQSNLQVNVIDAGTGINVLRYNALPNSFVGNLPTVKGPSPGALLATLQGVKVVFQLTKPGYCRFMNNDPINFVTRGVYLADINRFAPIDEMLPGETYVTRISRHLQSEFYQTGTGSIHIPGNCLMFVADTAPCEILVEGFEH